MVAPQRFSGRRVGVVITGGNIDARLTSSILMRGLVHDGQLIHLVVRIDDTPGLLSQVTAIVGQCGGNILEVEHNRLVLAAPVKRADLDLLVETRNRDHGGIIRDRLADAGFVVAIGGGLDLSAPAGTA
jgi:threonine dehydratase